MEKLQHAQPAIRSEIIKTLQNLIYKHIAVWKNVWTGSKQKKLWVTATFYWVPIKSQPVLGGSLIF
jgi:hypothetical protein